MSGPPSEDSGHVAPILAVEVAGQDEDESALRDKARWYLEHGVSVVWLVIPEHRTLHVLTASGESKHSGTDLLPPHERLPGLVPSVTQFFLQIDRE
jgi:Uma2 family endonuclease